MHCAATVPAAAAPKQLWELTGLSSPESALPDNAHGAIFVSNMNGAPNVKDGNGYVSKISLDGKMIEEKWATGMNAPKGLARVGETLFAADIDELVAIDIGSGKITARYPAEGAKFLNDTAADAAGNVYVSDMATNTIWRLSSGKFEAWLHDDKLENPNGLTVDGDNLRVAAWGVMAPDFSTKVPGHLLSVTIDGKTISNIGDGKPFGNLDGLEAVGDGTFLLTDWVAGKVMRYGPDSKIDVLLTLEQGTADIGYDRASKTLFLPLMKKGALQAYTLE